MRNAMLFLIVVAIFGCTQKDTITTPSGYNLKKVVIGTGQKPVHGEYILANAMYKDDSDSVWFDTKKEDAFPIVIKMDSVQWGVSDGRLPEILSELVVGDSVTFSLPLDSAFSKLFKAPVPDYIKNKNTNLTFFIKMETTMTVAEHDVYRAKMEEEFRARVEKQRAGKIAEDVETIDAYLKANNLEAQKTSKGVHYVVESEGEGELLVLGDQAKVHYAGRILDGPYFDSSMEEVVKEHGLRPSAYEPYPVVVGRTAVIEGWHDMLMNMKKGGKVTCYIPSSYAYGPTGRQGTIPPNTILVFDMEVVDVVYGEEHNDHDHAK